jgi:hypothetical protein
MTRKKRRSDLAGRRPLRSPGRPPVWRRDHLARFWSLVASGRSSEDAAVAAGVSPVVGTRWFREAGGMPPSHLAPSAKPASGRYLSFAEREETADLCAWFGVGQSTASAKARIIAQVLDTSRLNPEWSLPSLLDQNPLVWMAEVNGFLVDLRDMPREVQQIAFEKGMIPYIPADQEQGRE